MLTCVSCGFTPKPEVKTQNYCIKCGRPLKAPTSGVAAASPMTLIEAPATQAPRPSSSRESKFQSGTLPRSIDGFEILALLGFGGMGCVLLAYEPLLDRQVALKVLDRSGDNESHAKNSARFLSEAALTGRLGHSGIVPIYRVGHDADAGYYYTMRLIRGRTLYDIIRQIEAGNQSARDEFTLNQLLRIFVRVCDAVGYAHNEGIIHRDIKPANVMVTDFGEVFVVDWGLAKSIGTMRQEEKDGTVMLRLNDCRMRQAAATQMFLQRDQRTTTRNSSLLKRLQALRPDAASRPITGQSQVLGTPGFLSPEQANGFALDPASDVYSLGVMLYELLTHQLPVRGPTAEESIVQTMTGKIVPIKECKNAARLPNAICEIVTRALSLDPTNRYRDALEFGREISLYLDGRTPWKPLLKSTFSEPAITADFNVVAGEPGVQDHSLLLAAGAKVQAARTSPGDFSCEFDFWAVSAGQRWELNIGLSEVLAQNVTEPRYEFRVGVNGGNFVELYRSGSRVRRRFDVRMMPGHRYRLKLELEHSRLRLTFNDKPCIAFNDVFPQTGGALELSCAHGQVHIANLEWLTRGAPLQLSFMSLPDRLYRAGRYSDARELYRQLASSHPDREEGLQAQYKAGLCSAALKQFPTAFDEFARLEGSMLEHCCALGLAQIGLLDGNIDWAWEALKNGCSGDADEDIRIEMWFALLALIEQIPDDRPDEKVARYNELLNEVSPEPHEAAHVVFDLLATVQKSKGQQAVRAEALNVLQRFPEHVFIAREALRTLSRAGFPTAALDRVALCLDTVLQTGADDAGNADLHILRAEAWLAAGNLGNASNHLRKAVLSSDLYSPAGVWARSWQALILYLSDDYSGALTSIHETLVRTRKLKSPQLNYLRLLEGICYFAKNQKAHALSAIRACSEEQSVWSAVAEHFLAGSTPVEMEAAISFASPAQISEALFLAGEAHRHADNTALAQRYFDACANAPEPRAMTYRLASARLEIRRDNARTGD